MKLHSNPLLSPASLATIALTLGAAGTLFLDSAHAGSATWTNGSGTNILNTLENWSDGGPPTTSGDTATWDGTVTGDLTLTYDASFGASPLGTTIDITSSQAGSISIGCTLVGTSHAFSLGNITIAANAGAFTFGGGTGNDRLTFRGTNTLTNDSTNTATFASDLVLFSGGGGSRTLAFGGSGNWQVDAGLSIGSGGSGSFNLNKTGNGTLTLAAINGNLGTTTVNGGKLTISSAGTINSTSSVSIGAGEFSYNSATALTKGISFSSTGGTLSGTGTITPAVTVSSGNTLAPGSVGGIGTLSTGATAITGTYACDLDAAASDGLAVTGALNLTDATLAVNALATPAAATYTIATCTTGITGSFTGLAEGATLAISGVNYTISYAAGGGNQVTLTKAASSGYSGWANANGATDQTVDQDHDTDGVKNGIEYFMGESGSGFTAQPALNASNIITWTMGDAYNGVYGTDYQVQTSGDLTTWTPVDAVDVTIDNIAPGKSLTYTLTGTGKRFVRLLVNPN